MATDENDDGTTPDRPSSVVDDSRKRRKGERKFQISNKKIYNYSKFDYCIDFVSVIVTSTCLMDDRWK